MKLWLDDVRREPDGWIRCKTVQEVINHLLTGLVEEMSLDHDLGTAETGYDLVKWCAENRVWSKHKPRVHSWNPVGAANMRAVINRYFPR